MNSLLTTFLVFTTLFACLSEAVNFEIPARPASDNNRFCLTLYILDGVLVSGFIKSPVTNTNMDLVVTIADRKGNVAFSKSNLNDETRFSFRSNSQEPRDYDICFSNTLKDGSVNSADPSMKRSVEFIMEVGYDMFKKDEFQKAIKPVEEELVRLEQVMAVIVGELSYLEAREIKMRDTNESTADRVKWFSLLTLFTLIGLGLWQVYYLKQFFQSKKLI